jgi:hypothetical protein
MALRTLVFFAAKDPLEDPDPVRNAFSFALTAAKSGLPAEVRLAGAALQALHQDKIPAGVKGDRLRKALIDSPAAGLRVSL